MTTMEKSVKSHKEVWDYWMKIQFCGKKNKADDELLY